MINLGAGYFVPQDISPNLRFEVFGDLGLGQFKNKSTGETNAFFNGKYTRIGIMPNIGYTSSDQIFSIAYSLRACNIRFHSAEINNVPYYSDDYKRYSRKHDYNMMEHAVMAQRWNRSSQITIASCGAAKHRCRRLFRPSCRLTICLSILALCLRPIT